MGSREPIATGEWYHCYNRGVDRRIVFEQQRDYERFLAHVYVANGTKNIRVSMLPTSNLNEILRSTSIDRGEALVDIGAYALMPNHVHFVLKELHEGGLAVFMQKLFTGYTMYFNNKNARTGALFAGTFKSRHVYDDRYLKRVVPYVLLNPAELFDSTWKDGTGDIKLFYERLIRYPYSSLPDFAGQKRPHGKLLGTSLQSYYEEVPSPQEMLSDAQAYYREHRDQLQV